MANRLADLRIEEINGWDETALHDCFRAHPSLRCSLGYVWRLVDFLVKLASTENTGRMRRWWMQTSF